MPLVKKRLSIAAGATSDQVLAGTTYEYVDPGTRIVVAAALIQWEARLLTQLWTSTSTMPNLARMHQYRRSLLESLLVGTETTL